MQRQGYSRHRGNGKLALNAEMLTLTVTFVTCTCNGDMCVMHQSVVTVVIYLLVA